MHPFFIPLIALITLIMLPLFAQNSALPDFTKGMPNVDFERKLKIDGQETFEMKTALIEKEFSTTLNKFLGAGWVKQKLNAKEMLHAAAKGRTTNSVVNFSVYGNEKKPGVRLWAFHLKHKEANSISKVEITVVREKEE